MANYIQNLTELGKTSMRVTQGVPSDNRVVTVYDILPDTDLPVTVNARFKQGKWYGLSSSEDITNNLSDQARWSESFYFTPKCVGDWDNVNNCPIK